MVAAAGNIEHGIEIGCLTGAGEHGSAAAFHGCDLGGYHIAGRILQPGVEIAGGFQVKKFTHVLGGCVFKSGTLNDGNLTGLTVAGIVACLNSQSFHA